MRKLFSVSNIGSFHSRKRVHKTRYGIAKGEMSYMLHTGKSSFYFYPANCKRPIKPQAVFA